MEREQNSSRHEQVLNALQGITAAWVEIDSSNIVARWQAVLPYLKHDAEVDLAILRCAHTMARIDRDIRKSGLSPEGWIAQVARERDDRSGGRTP